MAGSEGGRWVWRAVLLLSAAVAVALVLVSVLVDLDTGNRVASVVGAVAGVGGVALAVHGLTRPAPAAGDRSVQAGQGIGRAVTGDNNRLHGPAPAVPAPAPSPAPAPPVPGERGVAAAGGIGEAVTGDGNEQR
ncbi:hypothetical protein ACGFYU_11075 [Streptomyces sp. NPDC048337]|uniref:hypothetical protein n=1 Tax=Streptomyces sp. NPDC048337 TaxID=3365535 RepID=UPI00371FB0FF